MVVEGDARADRADGAGEMRGTAVGQIIAVDRGDHRMRQAHAGDGIGHLLGLVA